MNKIANKKSQIRMRIQGEKHFSCMNIKDRTQRRKAEMISCYLSVLENLGDY